MANTTWLDVVTSIVVTVIVLAIGVGIFLVAKQISTGIENTKLNLKKQGISLSDKGVSIKTDQTFDHEHYIDSSRQAIVNNMDKVAKASSFKRPDPSPGTDTKKKRHNAKTS